MSIVYACDDVGPVFFFPIGMVQSGFNVGGYLYRVFGGASDGQKNTP